MNGEKNLVGGIVTENDPKKYNEIVNTISCKSRQLIEQNPRLEWFQEEIDRRLLNAPDQKSRQEILDMMLYSARYELNSKLHHINELLDSFGSKLTALQSAEAVHTSEKPHP